MFWSVYFLALIRWKWQLAMSKELWTDTVILLTISFLIFAPLHSVWLMPVRMIHISRNILFNEFFFGGGATIYGINLNLCHNYSDAGGGTQIIVNKTRNCQLIQNYWKNEFLPKVIHGLHSHPNIVFRKGMNQILPTAMGK